MSIAGTHNTFFWHSLIEIEHVGDIKAHGHCVIDLEIFDGLCCCWMSKLIRGLNRLLLTQVQEWFKWRAPSASYLVRTDKDNLCVAFETCFHMPPRCFKGFFCYVNRNLNILKTVAVWGLITLWNCIWPYLLILSASAENVIWIPNCGWSCINFCFFFYFPYFSFFPLFEGRLCPQLQIKVKHRVLRKMI